MIRIDNITKSFEGLRVLENVSFHFPAASTSAVAGRSGRGKTTLINILLGLMKPDSGTVSVARGTKFACVFQEDRLVEHMTARQNLQLVCRSDEAIDRALSALELDPANTERVSKYSGGMRRRVAIARAVLVTPSILILDEPFKGLDADIRAKAADFILRSCPEACRILVTHDPAEAELMRVAATLEL